MPAVFSQTASDLRARLARELGVSLSSEGDLQGEIMHKLAQELKGPDHEVIRWVREGKTPLGIDKPIIPCGVFPLAEPKAAGEEADSLAHGWNYSSYEEHREGAEALLRKEVDAGWLRLYDDEAELEAEHGPVYYSRIGVIAKMKAGQQKLRLIHDLRRSGVNKKVTMKERVVLPRISDFIDDVLTVNEQANEQGAAWETLILDFSDAFKHLKIDEAEQKYLAGRALQKCFVSVVLLFGVRPGPLLWGRLAAFTMRLTCAVNLQSNAKLQCYVDDPALTVGGTRKQRSRIMIRTVLVWLLIGLKLAWKKGQRGNTGEWVGAYFRPWSRNKVDGVVVGITKERAIQLGKACKRLLNRGDTAPVPELRQLAGLASWMSGLMPQLNAFTRMLWAAVYSGSEFVIARRQVELPLRWLAALADENFGPLERRCRRRATHHVLITFDGSLTGGGATLQAGIEEFSHAHTRPFVSYWAANWTEQDLERLQVKKGDPAGQARLEAFTLLISVFLWQRILREAQGTFAVMGDALGVLHDARKFRAKDRVLNEVMAEMALLVAPMGQDLRAVHLWTQCNSTCDVLSRLTADQSIPEQLGTTQRTMRRQFDYKILGKCPREQ